MEIAKTIAAILTLFVGVPVVIATVIDKLTLRSGAPARTDEELEGELLSPQWEALANHFGAPATEGLKSLYSDKQRVLRREFEVPGNGPEESHYLAGFLPANVDNLKNWDLSPGHFPFASDGCGNCYTVRWGQEKVYYWDHEEGVEEEIGQTLDAFT